MGWGSIVSARFLEIAVKSRPFDVKAELANSVEELLADNGKLKHVLAQAILRLAATGQQFEDIRAEAGL